MTPTAKRGFVARMAELPEALAFVEGFCRQHGVARNDMLRLRLVVEELFTNTVEHGLGGQDNSTIRLELGAQAGELALLYEDATAPFDAPAHLARQPLNLNAALDERPIGGLGLPLIEQMAQRMRYAREDGRNRLWIGLRREA
jgi:serine/threonine-protein kinase RsbW